MTKMVKKVRKFKVLNFSFTLFLVLGVAFIFSTTLLRSYNVALSAKVSKMNDETVSRLAEKILAAAKVFEE